jgi:hypothetical protein
MARSPAEIQTEINLTREDLARGLDVLQRRVPGPVWLWPALLAAGLVGVMILTRTPMGRFFAAAAQATQAALGIAAGIVTLRRALAAGAEPAAPDVQAPRQLRNWLRRAA